MQQELPFKERKAVHADEVPPSSSVQRPVRTLKIEADGDFSKGRIKPKIRIMGKWLERAGFKPGTRVLLTCIGPGVIELRSPAAEFDHAEQPGDSTPP